MMLEVSVMARASKPRARRVQLIVGVLDQFSDESAVILMLYLLSEGMQAPIVARAFGELIEKLAHLGAGSFEYFVVRVEHFCQDKLGSRLPRHDRQSNWGRGQVQHRFLISVPAAADGNTSATAAASGS